METIKELTGTYQSDVRGATSGTYYPLTPIVFLKEIVDAAQKRKFFEQFAYVTELPVGTKDVIIPKRTAYLGRTGVTMDLTEATTGTDVSYTAINNLDGLTLTPVIHAAGVTISNHAIRTNAIDIVKAAQDELTEALGDRMDFVCATVLSGTVTDGIASATYGGDALSSGAAAASNSVRGAQTVYGGDAASDSQLAAGDTLTTDMIAEAKRKLQSTSMYYWVPSSNTAEAKSAVVKNPWLNDPAEPFVLFIGPEQEEVLLTDSQFVNASEYGNNEIVMNGEIGRYLGVKIVVTPNLVSVATDGTPCNSPDAGTGNSSHPGVAMTRCLMIKARKSLAIAYGLKPNVYVFDYPSQLQKRIVLETAYTMGIIHSDAIVWIDVADV